MGLDSRDRHILIVGSGSMGRRHAANLRKLGWKGIRLYRTGHSTLEDEYMAALPADVTLDAALERKPVGVIVANPSALHMGIALASARAGAHLLIEKPLSHDLRGRDDLANAVMESGIAALVGFQFRFNPGLKQIKKWLDDGAIGTVVSAQVHWGEYLPSMHAWEDYRQTYAARPELGGGVLLTLCHPFDYLRWILGDVSKVCAAVAQYRLPGAAVDASVDVTLQFGGGCCGHVHLNFVQRPTEHRLTIVGTEGTIHWSAADHVAVKYAADEAWWETVPPPAGFERNQMFLDEMRHFLACLRGEEAPVCTLHDGWESTRIVLAAQRSMVGEVMPC